MDDYALVLNAGSSSLKFCVYRSADSEPWRLEIARPDRGHRHLAATSPRRTAPATRIADAALDDTRTRRTRRARRARPTGCDRATAARASSASATASSTAARASPRRRSSRREVLAELRTLIPLAPLHQPHNLAAIEAVAERLPDVPQVACFDTSFHRGQPPVAGSRAAAARDLRRRRPALRLSRPLVRVHRVGAAARSRRRSPTDA